MGPALAHLIFAEAPQNTQNLCFFFFFEEEEEEEKEGRKEGMEMK